MNQKTRHFYSFGPFRLDARECLLILDGKPLPLAPKAFEALLMLVENAGHLVDKDDLMRRLWPSTFVEEANVAKYVSLLRNILSEATNGREYIETIPKRGYRFVVEVREAEAGSQPQTLPGASMTGKKVSHYRVLEVLGGGGMGVVYKAEDLKLGRRVALKFLPEEIASDAKVLERFEREARAASALDHPNICAIHEFGEHEGRPFIAMSLLEGQNVRDQIAARAAPFATDELLHLAIQIGEGLAAAHEKGIVHRDIKPANIFITNRSDAKILDFGLAKLTYAGDRETYQETRSQKAACVPANDLTLSLTGVAMGTAPYMSPEQVRGEKLDARSDLFSFGLVIYEMATRKRTFSEETAAALQEAILNRTPVPARDLNPQLPRRLEEIINKALEKDREARYQTAAEMCTDLKRLKRDSDSEDPGIVASLAVVQDRARTNWRLRALLGSTVALILAVLGFGWYRWVQGHSEPRAKPTEQQLTANPPEDYVSCAAISPDGKHVAFVDQTGLLVRSVASGETRPIKLPADFPISQILDIRWLPDGGKLLITRQASVSQEISVWTVAVIGEAAPQMLRKQAFAPAISPDGKSMAFERGPFQQPKEIWVSGMDGEAARKLAAAEQGLSFEGLVWSRDSHWIAYVRTRGKSPYNHETTIEIRPATGGPAKTVVSESSLLPSNTLDCWGPGGCLCWRPDGNLVFTVKEGSELSPSQWKWSLWQVRVDPEEGPAFEQPRRFAHLADFSLGNMTTTADGKILAFTKARWHKDVYVGELDSGSGALRAPRRLTLDDHDSYPDAWIHDNQSLLFVSNRYGKLELFKQGVKDGFAERIVSSAAGELGGPAGLSADGSWILYWQIPSPDGKAQLASGRLMRQHVAGGPQEMVLETPFSEWLRTAFACPQKPGNSCVLGGLEGNSLVFFALDPVQGKGDLLSKIKFDFDKEGPFFWAISPDGSQLAMVDRGHKDRIEVLNLANRAWREITVDPGWGDYQTIAWAADGKGFFLTTSSTESFNLIHVTLTGKVQVLLNNARRQPMFLPLPSTDGKYLAFQAITVDSNVWILENF